MGRSSHAEYVTVPANQLTPRPATVPWEVAGSLFVAGVTAYAAVRAVRLAPGDTVAIAGAAGGVGSIAVQLARRAGATVLGIAGPSNDAWLVDHGAVPVNYGDDLPARLRAAARSGHIDALLDFFGGGYVALAVEDLKLPPDRGRHHRRFRCGGAVRSPVGRRGGCRDCSGGRRVGQPRCTR